MACGIWASRGILSVTHTKKKLSILYAAIMEVLQCNTCQDTPLTPPAIFASTVEGLWDARHVSTSGTPGVMGFIKPAHYVEGAEATLILPRFLG